MQTPSHQCHPSAVTGPDTQAFALTHRHCSSSLGAGTGGETLKEEQIPNKCILRAVLAAIHVGQCADVVVGKVAVVPLGFWGHIVDTAKPRAAAPRSVVWKDLLQDERNLLTFWLRLLPICSANLFEPAKQGRGGFLAFVSSGGDGLIDTETLQPQQKSGVFMGK